MSFAIKTYYLHGIGSSQLPESLDELRKMAGERKFTTEALLKNEKWDFLIREGESEILDGFVPLGALAKTKRGIATGANEYFHLSASAVARAGLSGDSLIHCVGKAQDVTGIDFTKADLQTLIENDRRAFLVVLGSKLNPAAQEYISEGEAQGLNQRYLMTARKVWYSMESQKPAPIWAAVFGRQGLRFIHNKSRALTLTTFHCVYPKITTDFFEEALTLCLNAPSIQAAARAQTRVYGGGLLKFEPKDLLSIFVPDLSRVGSKTLRELAEEHAKISVDVRKGIEFSELDWSATERLITKAAFEASSSQDPSPPTLLEKHQVQTQLFPLQAERKRRVA